MAGSAVLLLLLRSRQTPLLFRFFLLLEILLPSPRLLFFSSYLFVLLDSDVVCRGRELWTALLGLYTLCIFQFCILWAGPFQLALLLLSMEFDQSSTSAVKGRAGILPASISIDFLLLVLALRLKFQFPPVLAQGLSSLHWGREV